MLPMLSILPLRVFDQLETPRWILLTICVIGVVLAYVTDEGYSLLIDDEGSSLQKSVMTAIHANTDGAEKISGTAISETADSMVAVIRAFLPEIFTGVFDRMLDVIRKHWGRCLLYRDSILLKRQAKTKRQYFYLMEKRILNLPIKPNESEIDSYLDCKSYLGQTWPFMWEVNNVKADKVGCSGYECVPVSSYSYLDLIRDNRVQRAAIKAAEEWSSGNHGPRMLGGNTTILKQLEGVVSSFFGRDDTLLCATGYLACMSACAAVSSESAVIFADSRLHASLRAGLKIGDSKVVWFKHNDFADCERKIKQFRHKFPDSWMIIESVYSMDGDICNLPLAHELCVKYSIEMMIDEAHGLGVIGKTGRGVEEHFNLRGCATLIVGTFSKSIASIGGYITGPAKFISYLDFHAPGNVFSAPLPAYCAGAAIRSFQLIDEEPHIVTKAQEMSKVLREALTVGGGYWPQGYPTSHKYDLEGDPASTVLPIVFPDDIDRVMRIATKLKRKGYMCSAVAYPACPLRRPRFRITATAAYTPEMIDKFVKTLVETCVEEAPSSIKELVS